MRSLLGPTPACGCPRPTCRRSSRARATSGVSDFRSVSNQAGVKRLTQRAYTACLHSGIREACLPHRKALSLLAHVWVESRKKQTHIRGESHRHLQADSREPGRPCVTVTYPQCTDHSTGLPCSTSCNPHAGVMAPEGQESCLARTRTESRRCFRPRILHRTSR